mmetsp:Transcript_37584/g.37139  ORF Transcript_37584/g.37139 Transcript_37584/m.37139 type:complete len:188 (-) Transcript_37584:3-566(-)
MLDLYACDKSLPKTKAEFESYKKLGKFQRHEKYPDPLIRDYVERSLLFNFSNEQYQNFTVNYMNAVQNLKEEVRDAISTLYEARSKIYKAIMTSDVLKTQACTKTIKKEQFLRMAEKCIHLNTKVTFDHIFNITKEKISVEKKIDIPNPKLFSRALTFRASKPGPKEFPSEVSELYSTTLYSCRNAN